MWSSGYDSRLGFYKNQLREVPGSSPGKTRFLLYSCSSYLSFWWCCVDREGAESVSEILTWSLRKTTTRRGDLAGYGFVTSTDGGLSMGSIFLFIGSIFATVCGVSTFTLAFRCIHAGISIPTLCWLPLAITSDSSMVSDRPGERCLCLLIT